METEAVDAAEAVENVERVEKADDQAESLRALAEQQLLAEKRRSEELQAKLEQREALWSEQQVAERDKWNKEREQLEEQLKSMLAEVTVVRNNVENQGRSLVKMAQVLTIQNSELEEALFTQNEALEHSNAKVSFLESEEEAMRERIAHAHSEASQHREQLDRHEVRKRQESERLRSEQQRVEDVLQSERQERLRLEGVRLKLEQELQSALNMVKDSNRQVESTTSMIKLQEVSMRMRLESEVAESRRAVALLRAEFATEQAQRLCSGPAGGRSPRTPLKGSNEPAFGSQAEAPLSAYDPQVERQQLEQILSERERQLAASRSELAAAQSDATAARERARVAVEDLSKAASESVVNQQEMTVEREKNFRLTQALHERNEELLKLKQQLLALRWPDSPSRRYDQGTTISTYCPDGSPPGNDSQRLAGLAKGSAVAVSALLQQVQGLGDDWILNSPLNGEGAADDNSNTTANSNNTNNSNSGERPNLDGDEMDQLDGCALQSFRALERQSQRLNQRVRKGTTESQLSQDLLSQKQRTAALNMALEQAAGRLERLHSRLKGVSPQPVAKAPFEHLVSW